MECYANYWGKKHPNYDSNMNVNDIYREKNYRIFHQLVLLLKKIFKDLYKEEGKWSKILNEKRGKDIKAINMDKQNSMLAVQNNHNAFLEELNKNIFRILKNDHIS